MTNSTFSENRTGGGDGDLGGGIYNGGGTATLRNTIVANSPSGGDCSQRFTPITDGGYNVDEDGSCVSAQTSTTAEPQLDPDGLQDNGGPTKTIALQEGSPAVDHIPEGTNGCGTEIKEDQRGVKRPQGKGCDVGAFEREVGALPDPAPPDPAPPVPDDCTIAGTEGDDVLIGTDDDDVICGLGGDDAIEGKGGKDTVRGGDGDDTLKGGKGKDTVTGGAGTDSIRGGAGSDILDGRGRESGKDKLLGGPGDDECEASPEDTERSC